MITPKRECESDFLSSVVDKMDESTIAKFSGSNDSPTKVAEAPTKVADSSMAKTASVIEAPVVKTTSVKEDQTKVASVNKVATMSLFEVRKARRAGSFIKVAGRVDLYQNADTKDFWKISDDKKSVVRIFDEKNGVAV